jgi:trehalose 6-phosphate phosphatase
MPKIALAPATGEDAHTVVITAFLAELRAAGGGNLILDYDGTLAPFTSQRGQARPYPDIPKLLDEIMRIKSTRLLIISGRTASSVALLLGTRRMPEIWGSHGMERINAAGVHETLPLSNFDARVLADADLQLTAAGLGEFLEFKPGSVAVHWRDCSSLAKSNIDRKARKIMDSLAAESQLAVLDFSEGIELKVSGANKGDAVRTALGGRAASPTVYVGDDFTDEDAFLVVNEFNGLSILMRREHRETSARAWFRAPSDLIAFLRQWIDSCGGNTQ